jgi:diguanylate cyclase (GGDEF)-like protein
MLTETFLTPGKETAIVSRPASRALVAVVTVVVALAGIWGAGATFSSARSSERAKRVETGYERARYALAVERTALRASDPALARQELRSAAHTFSASLSAVRDSGGAGDDALSQALAERHQRFVAAANVGRAGTADSQARKLDAILSRGLGAARERSDNSWPDRAVDKLAIGGMLVLLAAGLAACGVALARLVGYRRRLARERRDELARLSKAALTDSLTGLGNHRSFHEGLEREIARRARSGSCFSIVMLDLDGLKEVNDTLGHQAGDARLRALSECLLGTIRASDSAYRTGGDEFMVLLPDERAWGAFTFAQRLQREALRHQTGASFACGIAETTGIESAETLLRHADVALYEAKRSGRRIVVFADGLAPKPAASPEERASRHHQRLLATALARAVDAKDASTRSHCETVSELCALIGEQLGLDADHIERLRLAGLLHDVGKIGVADRILRKAGSLDDEEAAAMRGHVRVSHSVVEAADLEEEARWVLHHHEHVDGSGYPHGLRGEEIPLESRIILVADAFEAMTADRPYSPAIPVAQALAELDSHAGRQFDRGCVNALHSIIAADGEIDSQADAA